MELKKIRIDVSEKGRILRRYEVEFFSCLGGIIREVDVVEARGFYRW